MELYNTIEVCSQLGISPTTLNNWYRWEAKARVDGVVFTVLPTPTVKNGVQGKPRLWTAEQIEELRKFKQSIVKGRSGAFGKYSHIKKGEK